MNRSIRYVPNRDIDRQRWDQCLEIAPNRLIYPFSWYLDCMADHWDALVLNDYEAIMPLTWRKKYGISYLYQPFLTAQSGIFGSVPDENLCDDFIQAIPSRFKLIEIALNSGNRLKKINGTLISRNNFILDLSKPYEILAAGFQENTRRNINKAEGQGCLPERDIEPDLVISLAIQQMKGFNRQATGQVDRFRKLISFLKEKKGIVTYGISLQGSLLASAIFLKDHNRAYYILVGNHPDGRNTGASHALINAFIRDHAGSPLLLDFEGSDIPGLAAFYSSFGAVNEPYPFLRMNRLPFFLRWMK